MKKRLPIIFGAVLLFIVAAVIVLNEKESSVYTVGICQFTQHESLDAATKGFRDALTEKLGDKVVFDEQNAQGDYSTCTLIINDFISSNVDLILANSTTSLQTAVTATTEIPILGTSVTEYGTALQIKDFGGTVGRNISGTSDLAPLSEQAAMVKELFPDAKQVGILYCSAEPNSQYQADGMKAELEALGYGCKFYAFADSNDISTITTTAAQQCDIIYVPTDNTVASNAQLIANVCLPAGIPIVTGDESTCLECGVATLSIDYYDLGYQTGEMAVRVLTGEESISDMPIEYASDFTRKYNEAVCSQLEIDVPEGYVSLKTE